MQWGGIAAVKKNIGAYHTALDNGDYLEPCEYGHFECSRVSQGACHDEITGIWVVDRTRGGHDASLDCL
jgi:hypothetical protein